MLYRSKSIFSLVVFLFCVNLPQTFAQSDQALTKVLFVGNSYTYYEDLPQMVEAMAESQGIALQVEHSTAGGVTLGQHWRGERGLKTKEIIENNEYDFVVLQDQSLRAIEHPDSLLYFGQEFGELIKSNQAQAILYMTWSRQYQKATIDIIAGKYMELAEKINGRLAPVGLAWKKANESKPDLQLYTSDGSHPSALGAYLSACIFYGVLVDRSPIGLPHNLMVEKLDGKTIYLSSITKKEALSLQIIADQVLRNMPD